MVVLGSGGFLSVRYPCSGRLICTGVYVAVAERKCDTFMGLRGSTESQGQILVLTVLCVPISLDSGWTLTNLERVATTTTMACWKLETARISSFRQLSGLCRWGLETHCCVVWMVQWERLSSSCYLSISLSLSLSLSLQGLVTCCL